MTLEQMIREANDAATPHLEFRMRTFHVYPAWSPSPLAGKAVVYVHPLGRDGQTLDFVVEGNTLVPIGEATGPSENGVRGL
ncbi:hypothetical protein [Salinarimonas soli]|uniref:Uncharacterized protein n=1 Tax=Salinarimonas soli TaxID=1638099 RepID=A0A5B2VH80_9HYPH|nr:hypothetical protein [Salinarimonas soli]KAA2237689.1 hypothetical protein F0L46_08395 [Salinarimonas soli]